MTAKRLLCAIVSTSVLTAAALVSSIAPASAEKIEGGAFHDEGSFTDEAFCGVDGLVVDGQFTADGRFLARRQGQSPFPYFMDNTRLVVESTNRATGQHATAVQPRTTTKDLKITDNGDGTITIILLSTGGAQLYGDDGRLIAKNDGQVRFEIVIDYNGTPSDPSDDIELSSELIFGSTGTNDDFCAAILDDWGVTP